MDFYLLFCFVTPYHHCFHFHKNGEQEVAAAAGDSCDPAGDSTAAAAPAELSVADAEVSEAVQGVPK